MRRSGIAGSRPSSVAVAEMSRFPIYKKLLSKSFKYIGKRDICASHPGDPSVKTKFRPMLPRPDVRICAVVLDTRLSPMPGVIARRELLWPAKSIAWLYRWLATPEGRTSSLSRSSMQCCRCSASHMASSARSRESATIGSSRGAVTGNAHSYRRAGVYAEKVTQGCRGCTGTRSLPHAKRY